MENFGNNMTNGGNSTNTNNTTTSNTNYTTTSGYSTTNRTTNGTGYSNNATTTTGTNSGKEYSSTELPAQISVWTKVKNFLFQEIQLTMTPKQEKVLQEVHDFWHQDITVKGIRDFLFQEIEIVDNITL